MKQIRRGVFETNSSSTHSIAIPKQHAKKYPDVVSFRIGEFGWEWEQANPADYLYTAIFCYYGCRNPKCDEKIEQLKHALELYDIHYDMEDPAVATYSWSKKDEPRYYLDNGYIDHSEDLGSFLEAVFKDNETLLDFIFFGLVFTGNDNSSEEERTFIHRDQPTYEQWDYDPATKEETVIERPNPLYDKFYAENFEWYEKGN